MFDASSLPGPRTEGWRHGKISQLADLPSFSQHWSVGDDLDSGHGRLLFAADGLRMSQDMRSKCHLAPKMVHAEDVHAMLMNNKTVPQLDIFLGRSDDVTLDFSSLHGSLPLQLNITLEDASTSSISFHGAAADASLWLRINIQMGQGASLKFLQHDGAASGHRLFDMQVTQSAQSSFAFLSLSHGGRYVRDEITCRLASNCKADLFAGHHLQSGRHRDLRLRVDHLGMQSTSNQDVRCVVHDRAVSGFDGLIHVSEAGAQTEAYQESKVVLMEDGALHHGKPELEIFQDDVVCSHGAAIGQLDKDALFYLMSRGIAQDDARDMLLEAFFSGLVESATPFMGHVIPSNEDMLHLARGAA